MRAMMMHFALGAALATGLGKPVAYRYPTDDATLKKGRTVVEVQNSGFHDAVIYAVNGLRVQRLGTVTGMTVSSLAIPRDLAFNGTSLRFAVHPIGTRSNQVSDEIPIEVGAKVNLFIPPF
ncbi:MAG: hypothetical protein IT361_06120 [Gemmatimonadaceae bacterium]|nr:hypothetical protein [Gemmatimonadaceae bacterium]